MRYSILFDDIKFAVETDREAMQWQSLREQIPLPIV